MLKLAASVLVPIAAGAQTARHTTIRLVDVDGHPVPFALVSVAAGQGVIADDSGSVRVAVPARDSIAVTVRRIGFRPFQGMVGRVASGDFVVQMSRLSAALDTLRVVARQSTPLARSGFYDRAERVRKGAIVGEFITPEELDARNAGALSQLFQGRRNTHIGMTSTGGRAQAVLLGRAGCAMSIVVDGQLVTNTLQEVVRTDVPTSIRPEGTLKSVDERNGLGTRIGLDDIVDVRSVMGIEIFASTANGPAELIPIGGRGSCGFVAIWTGPRR